MAFPTKYKKEIVLSFKYKRVGDEWQRVTKQPSVLRLANRDCSWEFREPVLVGQLSDLFVEVRLHDDRGIDILNEASLLGDWQRTAMCCDAFMEWQSQRVVASEQVAF